ncbi:hypothetical protein [Thiofilum flexile]|uniref:hypothetical protein n=1 Tax=Thiofilum flexile TaxID=125627 RepID=UPI000362BDCC|nr:hypothetical protein [Thiofilum flexile]
MIKACLLSLIAVLLLACAPSPNNTAAPNKPQPVADQNAVAQIIIKFKPSYQDSHQPLSAQQMAQLSQAAGVNLNYVRPMSGNAHIITTAQPIPLAQAEALSAKLQAQPFVEYAEPDRIMRIQ